MKGVICYYSGSGNTKLACRYIAKNIPDVEFDLFDILKGGTIDLAQYNIVGLAAFTDFFAPSQVFKTFVENLPRQNGKPAFVFNTFGFISGKTIKVMQDWASARGFRVVAGYSLHTPESHTPTIAQGRAFVDSPNEKELARFNEFIAGLGQLCAALKGGQSATGKVSISLLNRLMPTIARTQARKEMGEKYVDEALCTQCGSCEKGCPYQSIKLSPFPTFDMDTCYGCWRCYNRCPKHAIYTEKFRGGPFYPKPAKQLKAKLQV